MTPLESTIATILVDATLAAVLIVICAIAWVMDWIRQYRRSRAGRSGRSGRSGRGESWRG